jgi:uncharacterized protein YgiM (DUF1202 family)
MGFFDAFKKKEEVKAQEAHPLQGYLEEANLAIENLQVVDVNGAITITGTAQDGESADKVKELLRAKRTPSVTNRITIADLSDLRIEYKVTTGSGRLNCRKGPGTKDEIVGKFPEDSIVLLVQKHNATWHKVRANKTEGYCRTKYLNQVSST